MQCVIPCAGRGTRLQADTSKVLIPINGKPLLEYVIEPWLSTITDFILIANHQNESALQRYGKTVVQGEPKGLAHAILQAESYIRETFLVVLGDCIMSGVITPPWYRCGSQSYHSYGLWRQWDEQMIRRGCGAELNLQENQIVRLVEKPTEVHAGMHGGLGLYVFQPSVFDYIRMTPPSSLRNEIEITDTMQTMIEHNELITPMWFTGTFLNVTYPEDIQKAERLLQ